MSNHGLGFKAARRLAIVVSLGLMGALPVSRVAGAPAQDCPQIMPVAGVERGTMGTGYTVSSGTAPEPFDAEILGVYPDALLPGHDLIVAEVHSPAIDRVGGVWYGMSGSPVFVRNELVGAVAWSFSFGPSHVIGLTAAEDMVEVMGYGRASASHQATASHQTSPKRVRLSAGMKRSIARASGTRASEMPDSLVRMRIPVSVSGVGVARGRALTWMQRWLNRRGFSVRLYAGASVSASAQADPAALEPGSNFAAALSYGDLTYAGVGTTTFVCDGFAMAFGHPFFFEGRTAIGANAADAITIWEDPVFSPFKLATVGGSVGAVDQDRFAGIRADFSQASNTIPVTSTTFAEDTGREEVGRTDIVLSEAVPFLAIYHEYLNVISAMDQYSGGSGEVRWTITGTTADGTPWKLSRANMVVSRRDLPYEVIHEMSHMISRLESQGLEKISFTGVDFSKVTVREQPRRYTIAKVLVSKNGGPFRSVRRMRVRRGDGLAVKVALEPSGSGPRQSATLRLRIPARARRGGDLSVFGGPGHHTGRVRGGDSFKELLRKMATDAPNNHLGARLSVGRRTVTDGKLLDRVVSGGRSIFIRIAR